MIKTNKIYVKELLTNLRVLSVEWEPRAESTWLVQYKDYSPIKLYDIRSKTLAEDRNLIGKEIEAQIYLSDSKVVFSTEKEKVIRFDNGSLVMTGIYEDTIEYIDKHEKIETYILSSVIPIEIGEVPASARIGDWLTAEGEGHITLLR